MLPMLFYQRLGLQRVVSALGIMKRLPGATTRYRANVAAASRAFSAPSPPKVTPARGERKYRVGFFLGCFQNMIFADASAATVRVLTHNGCEVVTRKM